MKNFLKGLWYVIKWLLLIPVYCFMPDKYSGVMPDEFSDGKKADKE